MKRTPKFTKVKIALISTVSTILCICICLFGTYLFVENFNVFGEETEASLFNSIENYIEKEIFSETAAIPQEETKMLVPLGDVFGIKIYTDGVIVSSLQTINIDGKNICPAEDAGVQTGDFIIAVNSLEITSNDQFSQLLSVNPQDGFIFTIKRGSEMLKIPVTPVFDGEYYRLGMWIRDSAAGIGTLTYYDPTTNTFAGLGHGICDVDTGELMILKDGETAPIAISNIEKGEEGKPGKICGYFSSDESMGTLIDNKVTGIYGILNETPTSEAIPIATTDEIKAGQAQIIATIETGETKYYTVEIENIQRNSGDTKNMIVEITDEELLEKAGGIIQGMSGSPIIQDGKIIGAVTHVFIDNPTKGYGIFIENMLSATQNTD